MVLQVATRRLPIRRFTVAEYYRMAEVGILKEGDRVELIEGEIIQMSPIRRRHAKQVTHLTEFFAGAFLDVARISVQNPIHLDDHSEPQPDLVLLARRPDLYAVEHPSPADILLLIEVADSSIDFDREIKIPLYARAGAREAWLIDLNAGTVLAFRDPTADSYRTVRTFHRGASISALAFPGREFAVEDLLS